MTIQDTPSIDEELLLSDYVFSEASQRKQAEEEFHDHHRHGSDERGNHRFYAIDKPSKRYAEELLKPRLKGARVLDYGSGNGSFAIWAAQAGALVSGVDISSVSVENARRAADQAHVARSTSFRVMDAEHMAFKESSFDVIVINGVLHHLDIRPAYSEIVRVLKPTGMVLATEAIRHNPIIHAYRKRTPELRTEWEVQHILGKPEIDLARQYFRRVQVRNFHLATLAALPLRKSKVFDPVVTVCAAVDRVLLCIPGLRWMGWMAVFTLAEPIK